MELNSKDFANDYIVVKAANEGAQVVGMTRGTDTRPHHTENVNGGEVLVVQFTDKTSLIKIKGTAEIYTKFGIIKI